MKTTVEIPDALFRRAKAKAALQGVPLKDLIVRGLQMAVEQDLIAEPFRQDFPLIRGNNQGRILTPEDVRQALDFMADEEAQSVAATLRR